jgi:biopolymer transport protein ExbD
MARRQLDEINAGSMADIAFLLLIFFLVTTTMEFDQGIPKTLPQQPPEGMEATILLDRNVLTVQANFNDELMVDEEPTKVEDLKDKVIEFMKNEKNSETLPEMELITKELCAEKIQMYKKNMEEDPSNKQFELWKSDLKDWEAKRDAVEVVGSYNSIPKLCVISVQTDNGTSYDYYIKIQDALKGGINFLRNEVCMKAYNVKFTDLKEDNADDIEKIRIIRAIIPERIAEMEPRNIQEF